MNAPTHQDLAGTIGAQAGRATLLREIAEKVGLPEADASDQDVDHWWGTVEIDRLASGLTLAAIATLSSPGDGEAPAAAWILRSDETGDEPTRLTAEGRDAVRRIRTGTPGADRPGEDPGIAAEPSVPRTAT